MARQYFLIKSEPEEYGWSHLEKDKVGRWDGVRNYAARNHLRAMKVGDWALFYHTGKTKEIVGIAQVHREHYPDPSADGADFSAVDFSPLLLLKRPVTLAEVKAEPSLKDMVLVKSSRLSVQPVLLEEFKKILSMSKTSWSELQKLKS